MTAPISHPLQGAPLGGHYDVSDARLERALRTLAAIMEKHGNAAMPIFDRLDEEYERRQARANKIKRFLTS